MKSYVFLIILGFIQLIFCNRDLNVTDYESYSLCPVKLLRSKRSIHEYTRWRANDLSTKQFLVKVLDDEITTSINKPVVPVNIQPVTIGGDKLVIGGGVKVPPPTDEEALGDYTRFVFPTNPSVAQANGNQFYPPLPAAYRLNSDKLTVNQKGNTILQPLRDDSPPASPQFIPRSPLLPRQQAPMAHVSFASRTTLGPITPPSFKPYMQDLWDKRLRPPIQPTRTTHVTEVMMTPETGDDEYERNIVTRSTVEQPLRTTLFETTNEIETGADGEMAPTTIIFDEDRRNQGGNIKLDSEKESDMMFYNDEDMPFATRKPHTGSKMIDKNEDDTKNDKENLIDSDDDESKSGVDIKDLSKDTEYHLNTNLSRFAPEIDIIPDWVSLKPNVAKSSRRKQQTCSVLKMRELNFNTPCTLPEIVDQLRQWAENSPVAKWVDITGGNLTTMENPIYMMIVDDPSSGQILSAKQTVMIVAGIQGRDHHSVASAMYVLYQLIERSEAHTELLTKYRFWIIPVFNPDGYDYSMTFPHRRNWTKNLRQMFDTCKGRESCSACETYGIRCTIQPCYGVNIDRNFEYQWIPANELRTEHQCGSLYAGPRQLSEAETLALTQFLHEQRTLLYTFIAFKEGAILGILYPYSHTTKKRAYDQLYRQRASRAAAAAYRISNRPYVAGQTSEFLPLYAGGIEDWVDGHLGIDNSYTIMMFRPSDSTNKKLLIERVVHEAYAAMETLLIQSVEKQNALQIIPHRIMASNSNTLRSSISLIPLILLWNG